jgi:hypothetical protein
MPNSYEKNQGSEPSCVSVVICNEIIEDKRTNNKTLVSLFNSIYVQNLPSAHPRMFIMASLTDATGKWPISFIVRAPSGEQVMKFEAEAAFQDPISVLDMSVEVLGLSLPEAGVYFVDIMTGPRLLGNRRFTVMKRAATPKPSYEQ